MEINDAKFVEITVDGKTCLIPRKHLSTSEWVMEHTPWIKEALEAPKSVMAQRVVQLGKTESMIAQVRWALDRYETNVSVMAAAESRIRERFQVTGRERFKTVAGRIKEGN